MLYSHDHEDFSEFFTIENFDVVKYYPYTSRVSCPFIMGSSIFSASKSENDEWLTKLWDDLSAWLIKNHKISVENKNVVKLVPKSNNIFWQELSAIYVGCYDGQISIGLGVWQPYDNTHNDNIEF